MALRLDRHLTPAFRSHESPCRRSDRGGWHGAEKKRLEAALARAEALGLVRVATHSTRTTQDDGPNHGQADEAADDRGLASSAALADEESLDLTQRYGDGLAVARGTDRELFRGPLDQGSLVLGSPVAGMKTDPCTLRPGLRLFGPNHSARDRAHEPHRQWRPCLHLCTSAGTVRIRAPKIARAGQPFANGFAGSERAAVGPQGVPEVE